MESSQWIAALGMGLGGEGDVPICFAHAWRQKLKTLETQGQSIPILKIIYLCFLSFALF